MRKNNAILAQDDRAIDSTGAAANIDISDSALRETGTHRRIVDDPPLEIHRAAAPILQADTSTQPSCACATTALPLSMHNIGVGTASWTDKSLIDSGRFYPADAKSAEDRLRFYASKFPMVGVDSSYYAIPFAQTASLWAERTPRDFRFNVKAFRLFTGHPTSPDVLSKDVRAALPPSSKRYVYYKDMPEELRNEL